MENDPSPTTVLVFAGGGAFGAVEVGMLAALVERGVRADRVVGSSVGAINAAFYAAEPGPEGVHRLERLWRGLTRADVFPVALLGGVLGLVKRRDHLVSPAPLRRLLESRLPVSRFDQMSLPCHVVATDLLSGEEVCLSSGPVVEAIMASSAFPAVFPPVRVGRHALVDGCFCNNTPLSTAVTLGARRIIVLPTGFTCALERPPTNPYGMALHALNLLTARQLVRDVERMAGTVELRVVPPLCPLAVLPHDFSRTGELIDTAHQATLRWLDDGGLDGDGIPGALRPHSHAG